MTEQEQAIPDIVLITLKQKIRRLNIHIKDCELRLKTYN